jgi:hypothetical protein
MEMEKQKGFIYVSVKSISMIIALDDRVFESRQRLGIFLFTTGVSRPVLRPTQPPIQ